MSGRKKKEEKGGSCKINDNTKAKNLNSPVPVPQHTRHAHTHTRTAVRKKKKKNGLISPGEWKKEVCVCLLLMLWREG